MADYRFCDHCQLYYDLDEVELDTCLLCGNTICPFCAIQAFAAGSVCTLDHRDQEAPDHDPDEYDFDYVTDDDQ
jgi:hypothetical protein